VFDLFGLRERLSVFELVICDDVVGVVDDEVVCVCCVLVDRGDVYGCIIIESWFMYL